MFINKDSIIINGVNMGQYLVEAQYGFNKLWGEDTGRSLAGDFSGTLLGIFPKLTLHFRKLSKEEVEDVAQILDSALQTVTYFDPKKRALNTLTTYSGDWSINYKGINKNEGFSISFISVSRRA